jgi:cytidine deaminase
MKHPAPLQLITTIYRYADVTALSEEYRLLLQKAQTITANAYAPYSNFWVGAALLLEDGTMTVGTNQENAAYPSGLCAERTAFFATSALYPNLKIKAVAIAARHAHTDSFLTISPCGACRQAMLEYEKKQQSPIALLMQGNNEEIYLIASIGELLPLKFDVDSLGIQK